MGLKCLIVEDDKVSAALLGDYAGRTKEIASVKVAGDGADALSFLSSELFDLIFLDLNLPQASGKEILEFMESRIPVIIVSSDPGFALESYKYNVVGYLIKPVKYADFLKAVLKVKPAPEERDYLFVKDGSKLVKLVYSDIYYIKGESNYVSFCGSKGSVMSLLKMTDLEQDLPKNFIRIHRSYIINIDHITKFDSNHAVVGGQWIPLSASYKDKLFQRITLP